MQLLTVARRNRHNFQSSVAWQSRNLSHFTRPEKSTCIIYPNVPDACHNDQVSVIYFVVSAPKNRNVRNAIRSTWATRAHPKPLFLCGIDTDLQIMNLLEEEAQLFNDIVIEDFVDTYLNLTIKTGFILKNFLRICPKAKYLVKCDDDVFVNPTVVETIIAGVSGTSLPLIGLMFDDGTPLRAPSNKYYIPTWLYNKSYYPTYLSGLGYLLPGKSVSRIFDESLKVPLINMEDVFFTGMIANEILNMTLLDRKDYFIYNRPKMTKCLYNRTAMVHSFNAEELKEVWRSMGEC
uniref:Hexosyltransferase n=1 Tax=Nyssomyia neivai TaxID=330878 RepID=A0A1L8E1W0_9DIPT